MTAAEIDAHNRAVALGAGRSYGIVAPAPPLPKPLPTSERTRRILVEIKAGRKFSGIAAEFHVTHQAISNLAVRWGLKRKQRIGTASKKILDLYQSGVPVRRIAARFKISRQAVSAMARRHGLRRTVIRGTLTADILRDCAPPSGASLVELASSTGRTRAQLSPTITKLLNAGKLRIKGRPKGHHRTYLTVAARP